jgi:hypothetical protein
MSSSKQNVDTPKTLNLIFLTATCSFKFESTLYKNVGILLAVTQIFYCDS